MTGRSRVIIRLSPLAHPASSRPADAAIRTVRTQPRHSEEAW
jgi:hypothetical protein